MKNVLDMDFNFDMRDFYKLLQTAVNAKNFTTSESTADDKINNGRFGQVSDDRIQR